MNSDAVLDKETGLVWEKSPSTIPMAWEDAQGHCNGLLTGNRLGWRLPTVQELGSLLDLSTAAPYVPSSIFSTVQSADYWSATTNAVSTSNAWAVLFLAGPGNLGIGVKSDSLYVWCVRGGNGVDPQ
ncbi:MAG: DUF1566 domain-containing protein [Dissulfurispiraceae bacterium]